MKKLLLYLFIGTLAACGGGGGGGDGSGDVPFYAGIWRGFADILSNDCGPVPADDSIVFTHTVNQVDEQVALDVLGGGSFRGVVTDGPSSFIVTGSPNTTQSGSNVCTGLTTISYGIQDDSANVVFGVDVECVNTSNGLRSDCQIRYVGQATRD